MRSAGHGEHHSLDMDATMGDHPPQPEGDREVPGSWWLYILPILKNQKWGITEPNWDTWERSRKKILINLQWSLEINKLIKKQLVWICQGQIPSKQMSLFYNWPSSEGRSSVPTVFLNGFWQHLIHHSDGWMKTEPGSAQHRCAWVQKNPSPPTVTALSPPYSLRWGKEQKGRSMSYITAWM